MDPWNSIKLGVYTGGSGEGGWVGLFTRAGLPHTIHGLNHEGVDGVGLESVHTDPGEGTVGVERTN